MSGQEFSHNFVWEIQLISNLDSNQVNIMTFILKMIENVVFPSSDLLMNELLIKTKVHLKQLILLINF
jgi:hypothetical protein